MIKLVEIQARNILSKTKVPDADFVVNPFIGCQHKCVYCYARYICRWIKEDSEWGDFVHIKINAPQLAKRDSMGKNGEKIVFSTVCDAYQPLESKYEITRGILENLNPRLKIGILTKSPLVTRDIDLLKKFDDTEVGLTIITLDEKIRKRFELKSPAVKSRVNALQQLHDEGIKTFAFIGPIMPYITDLENIMQELSPFVDSFGFEDLNLAAAKNQILAVIDRDFGSELLEKYKHIPPSYWNEKMNEIISLGKKFNRPVNIFFKRLSYYYKT